MIYLDNAATSWPKPPGVARAVAAAVAQPSGNPGRTSHHLAIDAIGTILSVRENLARLFNIAHPLRICLQSSTTEALNTAIHGILQPGDHAICTSMEHNSVWRPLVALTHAGVSFSIAQADACGIVDPTKIEALITPKTRLIVVNHASNVTGSLQPLAAIGEIARRRGVYFLVDTAQSAGVVPIDAEAMKIDLLAFPGHKGLLGPKGIGGLYVREGVQIAPLKMGGTGTQSLSANQPAEYPERLEAGTLNLPGIAGLLRSTEYILSKGVEALAQREARLTRQLLEGLQQIDRVTLYGPDPTQEHASVVSFNLQNQDPAWVAAELERRADIACRPGWHCAALAHQTLNTVQTGTVRLSPGPFTRKNEIEITLAAINEIANSSMA